MSRLSEAQAKLMECRDGITRNMAASPVAARLPKAAFPAFTIARCVLSRTVYVPLLISISRVLSFTFLAQTRRSRHAIVITFHLACKSPKVLRDVIMYVDARLRSCRSALELSRVYYASFP